MFRMIDSESKAPSIVQTADHFFACCEVDLMDNREGDLAKAVTYTMFFEIDADDVDMAKGKAKDYAHELGFRVCGFGEIRITTFPIDAGKFWVHGLKLEKEL